MENRTLILNSSFYCIWKNVSCDNLIKQYIIHSHLKVRNLKIIFELFIDKPNNLLHCAD
jgi:hypothetical protein